MWIASSKHAQDLDALARSKYRLSAATLMERAGKEVFKALKAMLPERGRIAVFCGKGNNGGDGFVVARLAKQAGYTVDVFVAAKPSELGADCKKQFDKAEKAGIECRFADHPDWEEKLDCLGCRDLVVDALLGTGAKGTVRGPIREAIRAINCSGVPVVSVDIPSGIDCDTGEEMGESVWALRTITFGLPKKFLFQGAGLERAGYWTVADIGLPQELLQTPTDARLIDEEEVGDILPERMKGGHKRDNGSVLIIAGSSRMPGAAALAALGALRSGAGLVSVAGVADVCRAISTNMPEVVLLPLSEEGGLLGPSAAQELLSFDPKFDAAVIGPGLTQGEAVQGFLKELWKDWRVPTVVDADALNAVAKGVRLPRGEVVLTPHVGELSRLLEFSVAEIESDRFGTLEAVLDKFGSCALVKGAHTLVGYPGFPAFVNTTGNPGMASGGMGDVLSGVIGTLLSQGLPCIDAALCGVYWHGLAADYCACTVGNVGYLATEVAEMLPRARATITSSCEDE
ncbi:MAG: NAD(P)H-hydrate dehydratase [Fimbriimonadaceae bacterium]|uniref:Bifunctional NAD(P)H-hydrate repair enzyme n=1 Tax=Candidatus Nitrosymbiomonas proteolyticus TaxID=2608984 RepID=A0A809R6D0_9BACT|nr:NAD(P)H-hydrate dehydratase [Fimbriimonadaceae bacterium]NUM39281.1 NAD(P)H-hydrate dehydratase [Armatimonadota bacterium]BBO23133.1 bifunctional NAD(P)H-hydrate repair enzyme Nnr [Candidatus Nitrosymbiomonas proteolyticus]